MRQAPVLISAAAFALAAVIALMGAVFAANSLERRATAEINRELTIEGITWATVQADGLLVTLTGTAPTEALRFRALSVTGKVVDASRVIDEMDVETAQLLKQPEFSLELLRNDAGVSMIGLIPNGEDRQKIALAAIQVVDQGNIADMLDTTTAPPPDTWAPALDFALQAMSLLPRSKISVTGDHVSVQAVTGSAEDKTKLETKLARAVPAGITAAIDISAPRPVITPFTLRFVHGPDATRFDACSAHTEKGRDRILAAARAAGVTGQIDCTLGLGVPAAEWPDAVERSIGALVDLGGGTLTFSDADVSLIALPETSQDDFDRVTGELETALPDPFSLHAVLPEIADDGAATPEFVATRSPEGQVQLRGRITDDLVRAATESYARSRFGTENVYAAMVLDQGLPDGWSVRVLTGLEGLTLLKQGSLKVQPGLMEITGVTDNSEAKPAIARLFNEKLGDAQDIRIDVTYVEPPKVETPTGPDPQECVDRINTALADNKITFAPSSASIPAEGLQVIDTIAGVLRECPDVAMEIGGHTDSQGREEMNRSLSQNRADAVLMALVARRILTANLTAMGYGESQPIADNETEEGREANRRIEFRLVTETELTAAEQANEEAPEGEAGTEPGTETPKEGEQTEGTEDTTGEQN